MKKLLSVILAALILVCPLSGFAANAAETLEWYFCDDIEDCDPWIYEYKGGITLGETEVRFTDSEFDYYTFNAENAGYYYVECNNYEILWFGFPEGIKDGKAFREAEGYYASESDIEKKVVFKLNAGETVFGIDFSNDADPEDICKVEIEYLGNSITDIRFDEGALDNLVLEYDLYDTDSSYFRSNVEVVFSSGKTVTFPKEWVQVDDDDYDWTEGENKATAVFMDFRKSVIVNACGMTDLITDVEFVNFDEYKEISTSFTDYYNEYIYGAELVFTLADGEKVNINTNKEEYIEINGRYYDVYAFYSFNGAEDVDIEIVVGGYTVKTYECEAVKSSYVDGSGMLFSRLGSNLKDSFYYSRVAFSELLRMYDAGDFEDTLSDTSYYFNLSFEHFMDCFTLIRTFMSYYF